jgi:hypothetical protein
MRKQKDERNFSPFEKHFLVNGKALIAIPLEAIDKSDDFRSIPIYEKA